MPPIILQPVGLSTRQASRFLGISHQVGERYASQNDKFFIVARRGPSLVGCTAGGVLADGSGAFYLPPSENCPDDDVLASLLDAVVAWFVDRNISRFLTLTSAPDSLLTLRGFQRQNDVVTLVAETGRSIAQEASHLRRITCEVTPRLAKLLERTYVDALDVPEQPSHARADLEEHLQYSNSGRWWTIQDGQDVVGLLLMGDARRNQRNLLYIGLVPAARSKGLGRGALGAALQALRDNSIKTVLTQVDEKNEPALRCYAACGFVELSRAALFVRTA